MLGTRGAHAHNLTVRFQQVGVQLDGERVGGNFLMKLRAKGPHGTRVLREKFLVGKSRGSHTRFFFASVCVCVCVCACGFLLEKPKVLATDLLNGWSVFQSENVG